MNLERTVSKEGYRIDENNVKAVPSLLDIIMMII